MKQTRILSKEFEVSNDFNRDDMLADISRQVNDKAFIELIQGGKHSLTIKYEIFVNEDEEIIVDEQKRKAIEIVKRLKKIKIPDNLKETGGIDFAYELSSIKFDSYSIY